jgi:hypothetical protein
MDNYPHVNCIIINKYINRTTDGGHPQPEIFFDKANKHMLRFHSTSFIPSIHRTDFFVENYLKAKDISKYPNRKDPIRTAPARMTNYLKRNFKDIGSYIWGRHFEPRYVMHIGHNFRAEDHQKKNPGEKWGTEHTDPETAAKANAAKWLDLPDLEGI